MSPLTKQQLQKIRDDRREQIKQAALKVFARRGITGTKTSMIAAEAGISEGLMYRYFHSKDDLFTELVEDLLEEAAREMGQAAHLPGTPYEQIQALTEQMLDEKNKYAFMLIQQARRAERLPSKAAEILQQHSPHSLIDRLLPLFVQGQQAGLFSAGDPRQLLSWYFFIINSLIMQEQDQEEYGLPDPGVLMRMLAKQTKS
ncbi:MULTISPECIES: TetR/AcrR family transcriptional regulator [Paenibacillus]|uniref:TetR/AcrR family transcriptional regulator n=1 Tax=Paenibacillus TaxID=44249 RepID=UPI0022B85858|nr:TetR/AcrR family transcriptional regulator [Paenibacillus caseinilyticus]MCZ8522636.1 TetR/AcrR family transcriptional regulator [Paenibacillus caseinilyticus]